MGIFTFSPNTRIESSKINSNFQNFVDHGLNFTMKWQFFGTLAVQTSNEYLALPDNGILERCDLIVSTAPTGAAIIVDIEYSTDGGGTWSTIFTNSANRPQVAVSAKVGSTTTIDQDVVTGLTTYFRAKIAQAGSTIKGADLSIMLRGKYNVD